MRPRFQNNARLLLASTFGALFVLFLVEVLLRKSRDFSPDFLASVLLYGLTVLNLTLLLILVFVLGRNLIRALMEQQRGVLGARFRLRLALVFLLVALVPCLLLLVVGSDLIQQTVDRWFNVDVERMLSSSQALGTALRSSLADKSRVHARALAREVEARGLLLPGGPGAPAAHGGSASAGPGAGHGQRLHHVRGDPGRRRSPLAGVLRRGRGRGPGRGRPRRPRDLRHRGLRRRASCCAPQCPFATPAARPRGP